MSKFPGVAFAFSALRIRGMRQGNKKRAYDATIGNAEFVNVLKMTD